MCVFIWLTPFIQQAGITGGPYHLWKCSVDSQHWVSIGSALPQVRAQQSWVPPCPQTNFLDQLERFPVSPTVRLMTQVWGWSIFSVFWDPQHFHFSSLIGNVSCYCHGDFTAVLIKLEIHYKPCRFPPFWSLVGHFSCEDGISQWKRAVFIQLSVGDVTRYAQEYFNQSW